MRVGTIVSLGASAVLGLGALVVAKVWLPSTGKHEKPVETVPVVAAAKPLTFGTKLDEKSLVVLQLPVDAAPAGAYHSVNEVIKLDAGGAPVALTTIAAREVLLPNKLSGPGVRASVAALINPGMRAYTIMASDQSGVGGHVLPGDRVDVLLTRQVPGGDQNVESDAVLQDVRVLAMNMNADQQSTDKAAPHTATLEVSPDDAAKLALAAKVGELSLALRRTGAAEMAPARVLRVSDLGPFSAARVQNSTAGYQAAAVPPPPAPPAAMQTSGRKAHPSTGGLIIVNGDQRSDANNSGAGA